MANNLVAPALSHLYESGANQSCEDLTGGVGHREFRPERSEVSFRPERFHRASASLRPIPQSILERQRWLLRYPGREWSGRESECGRNSSPEIQVRLSAQAGRRSHDDSSRKEFYNSFTHQHKVVIGQRQGVQNPDTRNLYAGVRRSSRGATAKESSAATTLVTAGDPGNLGSPDKAFRQGLRDLGYVEGENILVEYRYLEGKRDRIPSVVAELVRLKVDVLFASTPPAIRAAKEATTTIPIVMVTTSMIQLRPG